MLLESFKASSDAGYVIVPRTESHTGYISYNYTGMMPAEVSAWKNAITIPEVRRAHPTTGEDYIRVLQQLGIRCALAGTEACHVLRAEYHSTPLYRRIK